MKQTIITVLLLVSAGILAFGQMKGANSTEDKLIAQEKQFWEAFKNKDSKFFQETLAEEFQFVSPLGAATKAQAVAEVTKTDCTVKGYTLENTKVTMLNKDSALVAYKYAQDYLCNGKPEARTGLASTVFVKRSGKWLAVYHQDTPSMRGR